MSRPKENKSPWHDLKDSLARSWWLAYPHTFAEHVSKGEWKAARHLEHSSIVIAETIFSGGGIVVLNFPPGHGKSSLSSLWLPVWYFNLFPSDSAILVTHTGSLSTMWGRKVRDLLQSNPESLTKVRADTKAKSDWETIHGGSMFTAGIGGPIVGRRGNLLILDDPIKNWEEATSFLDREKKKDWFRSVFESRAEPNATTVVLMHRWHEDDIAGWIEREYKNYTRVLKFAATAQENDPLGRAPGEALWPERFPLEVLSDKKIRAGGQVWSAMWDQNPTPQEGGEIKRSWLKFYTELPGDIQERAQSWDCAFKDVKQSDFVVGQVWGRRGADKYLIAQIRDRMDIVATIRAIKEMSAAHPKTYSKWVEDKANGPAVIQLLKHEIPGLIPVNPEGSKVGRVRAVSPQWEAGNVYLPDPSIAPWVHDFIEEVVAFPNGVHDDQVDAMSQALLKWNMDQMPLIEVIRRGK